MKLKELLFEHISTKGKVGLGYVYLVFPNNPQPTIRNSLNKLVKEGKLIRTGRGLYDIPRKEAEVVANEL